MKTEFSPENVDDEEIIDLVEEVTEDGEEIIDLADGIDEITEEGKEPVEISSGMPMPQDSLGYGISEKYEAPADISIEDLAIESLIVEEPHAEQLHPDAGTPEPSDDTDIFLDLDRLIPDSPPQVNPAEMEQAAIAEENAAEEQHIFLDTLLPEEPLQIPGAAMAGIGLPLSEETPGSMQTGSVAVDMPDMPSETATPVEEKMPASLDTISEQQIDEALERVIRRMFQEKIAASIHEVVERIVQEEMQRLRALLLNEQQK